MAAANPQQEETLCLTLPTIHVGHSSVSHIVLEEPLRLTSSHPRLSVKRVRTASLSNITCTEIDYPITPRTPMGG